MATKRGYMRISTQNESQKFDRQEAELTKFTNILYADRISGSKRKRPQLDRLIDDLEEGDTVYILSIDRLSRSTKDLLEIVAQIKAKGASLKSIQDSWLDTSSENPMSDFLLTIMGALAEFERMQIAIRVREGVAIAQANGVEFGRPRANNTKVKLALDMYDSGEYTVKEIAEVVGLSPKTIYNYINRRRDEWEAGLMEEEDGDDA